MSFLESIQHGLEKASQQAARITKIQHLRSAANDLNFKASQQGQNLVAKAMEMYHNGILAQGELTAICKQISDYQQQCHEVQEELQRLQSDEDEQQEIPAPPPLAPGYQAYAQAVPPGYPAYPAPPAGYPTPAPVAPGYPPPAGYAPYPPQVGYPAAPGQPVQPLAYPPPPVTSGQSTRPPTQPLTLSGESPAAPEAPEAPAQKSAPAAHPHKAAAHHRAAPAPAAESDQPPPAMPGTYANGTLPPIYSPFAQSPAASAPAEPEHPARAHPKKAASDAAQEK